MKITERRLRQLIRSVIKESYMNEMFDMNFPFDSMAGAKGHADFFSQKVKSWEELTNVLRTTRGQQEIQKKYGGNAVFVTGMAAMGSLGTMALIYGSPLAPLAIGTTVAGAIAIIFNHVKDHMDHAKHKESMDQDISDLHDAFFEACQKAGGPSRLFPGINDEHEAFRMFLKQSADLTGMTFTEEDIDIYFPSRDF